MAHRYLLNIVGWCGVLQWLSNGCTLLQPVGWCCIQCAIYHELDVHGESSL